MNNKKKRIVIIALFAILLVAIFTGYTFSKYSQVVDVNTSSAVAKWQFAGKIINSNNSSVLSTISLADTINKNSVAEKKIAPGTKGDFSIVIDANGSEVDLDYIVELVEEANKPQNLIFTYDGETYTSLSSLISKVNEEGTKEFSGKILNNQENKEVIYNISWEWPYETVIDGVLKDDVDMQDAQTISDYTFTVKITGSQAI